MQISISSISFRSPSTYEDQGSVISVVLDNAENREKKGQPDTVARSSLVFKSFRKLGCIINRQEGGQRSNFNPDFIILRLIFVLVQFSLTACLHDIEMNVLMNSDLEYILPF